MFPKSVGVATPPKTNWYAYKPSWVKNSQLLSWLGLPFRQRESLYNYQTPPPSSNGGDNRTSGSYVGGEWTMYIKQKIIKLGSLKIYLRAHKPIFLILGHIWRLYLHMLFVLLYYI